MTTSTIINAAPMHISLGTQDLSTRALPFEFESIPTHLPKTYIYAKRGPITPQLVVGVSRTQMYGEDTFDLRKKWANHSTLWSNMFNKQGNAQMIERIIPNDIGPVANVLLSLELVETQVNVYERNPDGSYALEPLTLEPIITGKTTGYIGKWLTSTISDSANIHTFGQATISTGTLVGEDALGAPTTSKIYPVLQLRASSVGEDGNYTGFRLWTPTESSANSFDSRILPRGKYYPFRMAVVRREEASTTVSVKENLSGEKNVLVTLKPNATNPITTGSISIDEVFLDSYQNIKDVRYPIQLGDFGEVKVYQDNVDLLLSKVYASEKTYIESLTPVTEYMTDFNVESTEDERYLVNLFGAHSFTGWKYTTFQLDETGQTLSVASNIFNQSGSDGTMNNVEFAKLVSARVKEYSNPNSELQENAIHVESVLYDTGFPLETKYDLMNFIALRRDTTVFLSTYEAGERRLTPSEETSLAISLRTRAEFYPESDYFGTPVMRAYIQGRTAKLRSSVWKQDVSALYEIGKKLSTYMGASNGKWKIGGGIGGAPNSIMEELTDYSALFSPALARNRDWEAGLNWIMHFDRKNAFIPATKTVYQDDTSVLNSVVTVLAICELNKIHDRAWRYFSGVDNLTNGQLKERCENFIKSAIEYKFDGRFIIEPEVYFTDADLARGYSWSLRSSIYAANMKTVMTSNVAAHRLDDYAGDLTR